MKHDKRETTDVEPHVFDQTNGVVDLGSTEPDADEKRSGGPDSRTVAGIAMLSTKRP